MRLGRQSLSPNYRGRRLVSCPLLTNVQCNFSFGLDGPSPRINHRMNRNDILFLLTRESSIKVRQFHDINMVYVVYFSDP